MKSHSSSSKALSYGHSSLSTTPIHSPLNKQKHATIGSSSTSTLSSSQQSSSTSISTSSQLWSSLWHPSSSSTCSSPTVAIGSEGPDTEKQQTPSNSIPSPIKLMQSKAIKSVPSVLQSTNLTSPYSYSPAISYTIFMHSASTPGSMSIPTVPSVVHNSITLINNHSSITTYNEYESINDYILLLLLLLYIYISYNNMLNDKK